MSYPHQWQAPPGQPSYDPNMGYQPNSGPYPQVQVVVPSPYVPQPQYYYQPQPQPQLQPPVRMQNAPPPRYISGVLPPLQYPQTIPPQSYPTQVANAPMPSKTPHLQPPIPSPAPHSQPPRPSQTPRSQTPIPSQTPRSQPSVPSQVPRLQPPIPSQTPPPQPPPSKKPLLEPPAKTSNDDAEELKKTPADYQSILLCLADDYLTTAHSQSSSVASSRRMEDSDQYYKLVATSLGCLESVLKNWRLDPRSEALIRLKYARILYEETENTLEAETALSKGISICERNRLYDLKYSLQDLLARVLYQSNPKAAIKVVDAVIEEVVAYKKTASEYNFRFLRMSFSLATSSHQDVISAVTSVKRIAASANCHGHRVLHALCAVIEALVHLQSASADCIEQAQTALASARSYQLDKQVQEVPQIGVLLHFIDLSCGLQSLDVQQSMKKADEIRRMLEGILKDSRWRDDGSFDIPVGNPANYPPAGDSAQNRVPGNTLTFNWLSRHEIYALGYLLNGITLSPKNPQDGRKAEQYLCEGLRITKESINSPKTIDEALSLSQRRLVSNKILHCQFQIQLTFLLCSRANWKTASSTLAEINETVSELGNDLPVAVKCLTVYLQGVIYQGTGDLLKALSVFRSPDLALPPPSSRTSRIDVCRDTAILASLNCLLILREAKHPQHHLTDGILESVQPFCISNSSQYIKAAYNLVRAAIHPPEDKFIKRKEYLEKAFNGAKAATNNQITCIALSYLSWNIFSGVVGAQSEKASWAARAMAQKAGNRLWVSVADNLLATTLEQEGKSQQAAQIREEAMNNVATLPGALKRYKMLGKVEV